MESCEVGIDGIEAQCPTDVSHDQRKGRCFPLNIIKKGSHIISSRGFSQSMPPTGDTESVPDYLTNLRLSDLYNLPGEYVLMDPEIFSAMRSGNRSFLEVMRSYATPIACFKNEEGDSILHLAAAFGHLELVKSIVSECPCLLVELNFKYRLPLHLAARAGHSAVVEALVATVTFFSARLFEEDRQGLDLYVPKDSNGDTPLHLALKDVHEKIEACAGHFTVVQALVETVTYASAKASNEEERKRLAIYVLKDINGDTPLHLALKELHKKSELTLYQRRIRILQSPRRRIKNCSFPDTSIRQWKSGACLVIANQQASFLANKDGISPLYMATEAGNLSLVNEMLDKTSNLTWKLEGRKSLVHAALKSKNKDVLDVILNLNKELDLVKELDEEGRSCLSVGASVGFYEGICKLLEISTSKVYECDSDGSFPIHMAIEKGHMDIVKELLKRCPDSEYLLNKQGQNILHIAAKSGKAESFLFGYVKRVDTRNHLIEEQDVDGNTPLHLATINWRPRTLRNRTDFALTNPKILDIKNNKGWTALDIAKLKLHSSYIFRERMTLVVLLCVYAPRDFMWVPLSGMTLRSKSEQVQRGGKTKKYKDQINILLLVAALVATVTFAAGFTMPGGFNSSAPNLGMAILAKDKSVSLFLVIDSLAMQCSVVAIVALVWAQLGDPEIGHRALEVALPALYLALMLMALAFLGGVQATIKHNKFLYYWLNTTYTIFFSVILSIFVPYIAPQQSAGFLLPLLLWFVNEDDAEKHPTRGSGHSCLKRVESEGSSTSSDD